LTGTARKGPKPLSTSEVSASHSLMPSLFALHHAGVNVRDLQNSFKLDQSPKKSDEFHKPARKLDNFHRFVYAVRDYNKFPGAEKFVRLDRTPSNPDFEDVTLPALKTMVGAKEIPSVKQAKFAVNASAKARGIRLNPNQAEHLGHLLRYHYVMTRPGFSKIYKDAYRKFENVSTIQDATAGRKK